MCASLIISEAFGTLFNANTKHISNHLTELVSPPNFIQPKTEHNPNLRAYEGWIILAKPSLNKPGCQYACVYCNQEGMDIEELLSDPIRKPYTAQYRIGVSLNSDLYQGETHIATISPEKIFSALDDSNLFHNRSWVVLQNYSDPSLDNWSHTLELCEILLTRNHKGPVSFITKGGISNKAAAHLGKLKNDGLHLIGHISYSNLPREIEPVGSEARIKTLKALNEQNIPTIVSIRPLIPGINDSKASLDEIVSTCAQWTSHFTSGGIFVVNDLKGKLDSLNIDHKIDDLVQDGEAYEHHKYRRVSHQEILQITRRFKTYYHSHNTCAIAQIMTDFYQIPSWPRIPDYIDLSKSGSSADNLLPAAEKCQAFCPNEQLEICSGRRDLSPKEAIAVIQRHLEDLGYKHTSVLPSSFHKGAYLLVSQSLPLEELFPLMELTGLQIENLPNLSQLLWGANKRGIEHMNLKIQDYFLGSCLIGQEWFIFIDEEELAKDRAELLTKWIRNETKARVFVVPIQDFLRCTGSYFDVIEKLNVLEHAEFRKDFLTHLFDTAYLPKRREKLRTELGTYINELNSIGPYSPKFKLDLFQSS
jgi:hypothetical protein